ncbi:hypothetical protein NYE46_20810 [Listeria sp. FSL L8-0308]
MTDKLPQKYPKMTYEQLENSHNEWKKTAMDNYDWAKLCMFKAKLRIFFLHFGKDKSGNMIL